MKPADAGASRAAWFPGPLTNEGTNNVIWLTTMRDESIDYLKKTNDNIRIHYICFGPNIHQRYMMFFQHTFRHLGQIREVKAHSKYPK